MGHNDKKAAPQQAASNDSHNIPRSELRTPQHLGPYGRWCGTLLYDPPRQENVTAANVFACTGQLGPDGRWMPHCREAAA